MNRDIRKLLIMVGKRPSDFNPRLIAILQGKAKP